ncbi:MAG: hypothetical protein AAGH87_04325 [Pseudomonadota bacterium]
MSLKLPPEDRARWLWVAAGAHASLIGLVAWRVAPLIVSPDGESQPIELVPQAPNPLAELPVLETFYDVPLREVRAPISNAALPAPDAYPQFQVLEASLTFSRSRPAPGPVPPPASQKPEGVGLALASLEQEAPFPPLPDAAAQDALRTMLCDRMSATDGASCRAAPRAHYMSAKVSAEVEPLGTARALPDAHFGAPGLETGYRSAGGPVIRAVFAGRTAAPTEMRATVVHVPAKADRRASRGAPIYYR